MPSYRVKDHKKIAMLGSLPPLRALSSYCLEHASAIAVSVNVQFISFKKIYPSVLYPGGNLNNDYTYPIISNPNLRVRRRLTWYNPLSWFMEGFFADGKLLHAQWWSPPLALIYFVVCLGFKLRRKPVIFTIHNIFQHDKHHIYEIFSRLLFKLGDHYIVHSESNRRQLSRYFGIQNERISIIPHGPLDFHVQNGKDREKIRRKIGFNPRDKVILLFGTVRPYKGIDVALKAFSKVLKKIPEARLLIAGKLWEDWRPYDRLIKDLGITDYVKTYLEYIPSNEVHAFFLASDLVLLPYHHFDSQSGVGATAISFHKPMIVADTGGLPELVNDRRYVVPPRDAESLANRVVYCLADSARLDEMSAKAKEIAESIAWSVIAEKTLSLYDEVSDNIRCRF
jgi:glycosyltransferase involved in cell wall biosynthesis